MRHFPTSDSVPTWFLVFGHQSCPDCAIIQSTDGRNRAAKKMTNPGGEWYADPNDRMMVVRCLTLLNDATLTKSSFYRASRITGYEDSYGGAAQGFDRKQRSSIDTMWRTRTNPPMATPAVNHRRYAMETVRLALAAGDESVLTAEERRDLFTDLPGDILAVRL